MFVNVATKSAQHAHADDCCDWHRKTNADGISPFICTHTSFGELQTKEQQSIIKRNEIWTHHNKLNDKWQLNKVLPEKPMKLFTHWHDPSQNDNNE